MTTFAIRPAPLRAARCFSLADGELSGPGWSLDLGVISDVTFVSYRAYGRMIWRLDLHGNDAVYRIDANLPTQETGESADFAAFHGLATKLVEDLMQRQSALSVGVGERGWARLVMFALGLVSFFGGMGLGVAALVGRGAVEAAVPVGLMVLFGLVLIRATAPWKSRPRVDLDQFPMLLTRLAGAEPSV